MNISGTFYLKGGFDGASSQSIYKQKYEETDLSMAMSNEESLFQTALVPLKLILEGKCIWSNKKPNSSHFCRPLHLQYRKETKELTKEEYEDILDQMENIGDFVVFLDHEGGDFPLAVKIKAQLDLTMFDGKVINAITETASSQCCNICGAKPSELNNLEKIKTKPVNEEACGLGLSTLHC